MGLWVPVACGEFSEGVGGKAVGETAGTCWQPTLAAGTEALPSLFIRLDKEDLGYLSSLLGTTHLLSGKGLINWLRVGWEGFVTDGGAQWLSSQGFGDGQSWGPFLTLGCLGSHLELQWSTARRTWCQ